MKLESSGMISRSAQLKLSCFHVIALLSNGSNKNNLITPVINRTRILLNDLGIHRGNTIVELCNRKRKYVRPTMFVLASTASMTSTITNRTKNRETSDGRKMVN